MRNLIITWMLAGAAWSQTAELRVAPVDGEVIVKAPFAFTSIGATWAAGEGAVTVRGSKDGVVWSDPVAMSEDADNTGERRRASLTTTGEQMTWLAYRVTGSFEDFRFVFIDPGKTKVRPVRTMFALNAPSMVTRTGWGCPDGQNWRRPPSFVPVTHLIVHHTGDTFPNNDYAAWVRAIWNYHIFTNGWDDIGYNYLIDPEGAIYEGRAGGENVVGAHFSCQNSGTMGVALLGTFTTRLPTAAAQESLRRLLAYTAGKINLNVEEKAYHRGMRADLDRISGHRDGNRLPGSCTVTECPGDLFYPTLGSIRSDVAAMIAGAQPKPVLFDDAEAGNKGWTASGLWNIRLRDGNAEWWYGSPATGTYETGNAANSGTLESTSVEINGDAILTFSTRYETENSGADYDRKHVEVSVNGGPWKMIDQLVGTYRTWTTRRYELRERGLLKIRFRFDTVDGQFNTFSGWAIDNVQIAQ